MIERLQRPQRFAIGLALVAVVFVCWKTERHRYERYQDEHDPVVHGRRLSAWVAALDRQPLERPPARSPSGAVTFSTPVAVDYLRESPRLASRQIVAYLETRDSWSLIAYGWCLKNLPRPLLGALPRPRGCLDARLVVERVSGASFGTDPVLRAEWESLRHDADGTIQRMAYHALFETGSYPRGCYTNLLDGAPVLADGLQHVSPDIQKIVLPVVAEMVAKRQAAAWPASLPPLVPLLEHLATRSADLAIRFEADGILRALDPARPATASASKQGPAGPGTTANSLLQYPFASQPADLQPASSLRSATLSSEDLRY